jgi:hypothetical protein
VALTVPMDEGLSGAIPEKGGPHSRVEAAIHPRPGEGSQFVTGSEGGAEVTRTPLSDPDDDTL